MKLVKDFILVIESPIKECIVILSSCNIGFILVVIFTLIQSHISFLRCDVSFFLFIFLEINA